jgi:hypothetical protein
LAPKKHDNGAGLVLVPVSDILLVQVSYFEAIHHMIATHYQPLIWPGQRI